MNRHTHHHHHHQSLKREGRWSTTDKLQPVFSTFPVFHCLLGLGEVHACPFPDVVFPPLPLSALSSSPFHCARQDGFGQTWWTGDMTIPLQIAYFYGGQEIFMWSSCILSLGTTSSLVTWSLYKMSSIMRSHLISMACILFSELCCEGLWFTSIQEDECDKGVHQSYLGTERNAPVAPNWFSCQCCCCQCYPVCCLGDWWGWSFGTSATAVFCLSWEVWWLSTGSTG